MNNEDEKLARIRKRTFLRRIKDAYRLVKLRNAIKML